MEQTKLKPYLEAAVRRSPVLLYGMISTHQGMGEAPREPTLWNFCFLGKKNGPQLFLRFIFETATVPPIGSSWAPELADWREVYRRWIWACVTWYKNTAHAYPFDTHVNSEASLEAPYASESSSSFEFLEVLCEGMIDQGEHLVIKCTYIRQFFVCFRKVSGSTCPCSSARLFCCEWWLTGDCRTLRMSFSSSVPALWFSAYGVTGSSIALL